MTVRGRCDNCKFYVHCVETTPHNGLGMCCRHAAHGPAVRGGDFCGEFDVNRGRQDIPGESCGSCIFSSFGEEPFETDEGECFANRKSHFTVKANRLACAVYKLDWWPDKHGVSVGGADEDLEDGKEE